MANEQMLSQRHIDLRVLDDLFARADHAVTRSYLMTLEHDSVLASCGETEIACLSENTKLFRVDRLVYNKSENNLQKLTTLYAAAHAIGANLALLLHSDGSNVDLFLGVSHMGVDTNPALEALYGAVKGNFPGSLQKSYINACLKDSEMNAKLNEWFDQGNAIASVSAIPSIRTEENEENAKFVQGIERVVDAMRGNPFTMLVLAENISNRKLSEIKAEYEVLYSNLSPYAKKVLTYSEGENESVSRSLSSSILNSISHTRSETLAVGTSQTNTHTTGTSTTNSVTQSVFASTTAGMSAGIPHIASAHVDQTVGASTSFSHSRTKSVSDSVSMGTTNTRSSGTSEHTGQQYSHGEQNTVGQGRNVGLSQQLEYKNKSVEELLRRIDEHLQRIQGSECYGMYGAAAYFLAPSIAQAQTAASAYRAVICGQKSHLELPQINTWYSRIGSQQNYHNLKNSLRCLMHPVFCLENGEYTTPAVLVSGQEMAIAMGLPQKSIPGVSVIETAPFGRNVSRLDESAGYRSRLRLGNIYHMWSEEDSPVLLDKASLASHVFVTGSTGSGKSNTVYHLLDELLEHEINFMVVEPAKGEYKDVFGGLEDVSVYGTNPRKSELLRINPFAFPAEEISVQEHLDRLIEIFNACWPMYAAMPAILKEACEAAYISVGWDMARSVNRLGHSLFPSFLHVVTEIRNVLDRSDYSVDNKGDYTGALVTRLKSLTTGIFGQIFTNDTESVISGKDLFDKNVIVDLSRVGAAETKALIMGILVMQLQEYRIANAGEANNNLRHVTVLEEAHNLLKRASTSQDMEGSNLAGKSVEMLSNAIAEMRTYGEGFIIADQAPGLMDMSVIRNTNTKIIMRLPDESDRELVGKAASLSKEQIKELSKLPMGVAAVYQNNWLEPVLCKISYHETKYPLTFQIKSLESKKSVSMFWESLFEHKRCNFSEEEKNEIKRWGKQQSDSDYTQELIEKGLQENIAESELNVLCYNLFRGRDLCCQIAELDMERPNIDNVLLQIQEEFQLNEALAKEILNRSIHASMTYIAEDASPLRLRINTLRERRLL